MMARTAHAVPDVHMLATPAASRRSAPDCGLNSLAILLTSGDLVSHFSSRSNVTAQRPSVTGAIIITSPVPSRATEIPRAHAYAKLGVISMNLWLFLYPFLFIPDSYVTSIVILIDSIFQQQFAFPTCK
jgi:hypothetical protein